MNEPNTWEQPHWTTSSRHWTVRPVETGYQARGWDCPRCPQTGISRDPDSAMVAATTHAVAIHGVALPRVDVYGDGGREYVFGYCDDPACDECHPAHDPRDTGHVAPDLCQRCGGYGCDECRDCHCIACRKANARRA